jgi:hypothetical protein
MQFIIGQQIDLILNATEQNGSGDFVKRIVDQSLVKNARVLTFRNLADSIRNEFSYFFN